MRLFLPLAAMAMLSACGEQTPPGGVSADEAAALNDAAAMLDSNSVSVEALDDPEAER